MEKVCIIIRVYNRIDDLDECVKIIRNTWKSFEYYIIVVSNGKEKGFRVKDESKGYIDKLIELENNAGHLKGNSQLLLDGIPFIPNDCNYTIILEADTWIYGDLIIEKYIKKLELQKTVWASARWYTLLYSLATDFAIINSKFLKANTEIFEFYKFPEYYVANYIKKKSYNPIFIKEFMPVNLPVYLKKYPYTFKGRFCLFLDGKMITHHVEELSQGIAEKKGYFNIASGINYFDVPMPKNVQWIRFNIQFFMKLYFLIPHKSWFTKRHKDLR